MSSISSISPVGVELFCGVGGMSLGFEQAGFRIGAAVDVNPLNVETHRRNFPHVPSICGDLSELTGSEIRQQANLGDACVDVVFGGPPCQGFSIGGKREIEDARNDLMLHFARLVAELSPSYFVLENVLGLLDPRYQGLLERFSRKLSRSGYVIVRPIQALDACKFGVPQRRRRVFILGHRKGLTAPKYPDGCHKCPTVWDAIGDLACVEKRVRLKDDDVFTGKLGRPSDYARILRGEVADPDDHSGRFQPVPSGLSGFRRTVHSPETIRRFSKLRQGQRDPISRFFRLAEDGVSPTQRAGTSQERGSFMAPRPLHPNFHRCICLREAARLHSFPDWFVFHPAKWHGFMQVGNSVPPRLARSVAAQVMQALNRAREQSGPSRLEAS